MSDKLKQAIASLRDGNSSAFQAAIFDTLGEKINAAIDMKKLDIASTMLIGVQEELDGPGDEYDDEDGDTYDYDEDLDESRHHSFSQGVEDGKKGLKPVSKDKWKGHVDHYSYYLDGHKQGKKAIKEGLELDEATYHVKLHSSMGKAPSTKSYAVFKDLPSHLHQKEVIHSHEAKPVVAKLSKKEADEWKSHFESGKKKG